MAKLSDYAKHLKLWREGERGILRFVSDNFHVTLDPWQEQFLLLFASPLPAHRRIALQACVGPGKTAMLAMAGWWFMGTQGDLGEHPKGLVTAITGDNLAANLWSEYAKWHGRSTYLMSAFTWTGSAIFAIDHPATWRLEARSWPKTADPEQQGQTFSGLHGRYVLVQVDESGNIPLPVLRAADQALVRCEFGKLVQAGNPTSLEGMLYMAATRLRHLWTVLRITGDPDDPNAWVHSPRVGPEPLAWATEQIATYGRDNPWVMTQILGQFPPSSINALLGIEDVERAMGRVLRPEQYDWSQPRLGVDVARFGDDRTVIFPRQGLMAFTPKTMRNARTTDIAARVARIHDRWLQRQSLILIDDTGHWGHGVLDNLFVAGIESLPIVFHAKANKPQYANRRAEMWFEMADAVKAGVRLPNVPELIAELTTPTYTIVKGQILIEEKEQLKKRLGRSPDLADALALTYAIPDMPLIVGTRARQAVRTQDDPQGTGRALTQDDSDP